jgi:hypothetical protein
LKADKEYRENYAKWGMPSPAQLEKQQKEDEAENERLMQRWTQERIERERIEAMRMQARAQAEAGPQTVITVAPPQQQNPYVFQYPYGYPPGIMFPNRYPWRFPF